MRTIAALVLLGVVGGASCGASCGAPRSGVSPASGVFRGGDALRIEGEGFRQHGPPVIYVCNRPALGVVIESDRLIRVTTPRAEAAGACTVRIEFADGVGIDAGSFTYDAPVAGEEAADPFGA